MINLKEKGTDLFYKVKSYWHVPPKGYQVNYKEFLFASLGFGNLSFVSVLIGWTALAVSVPAMMKHFHLSTGMIFILGILQSLIIIVRSPIISMIVDNFNSKKGRGKFKPFIMWSTIATCVFFALIPFIPASWTTQTLFSMNIPAFFNIPASSLNFSTGLIVMFVLMQLGGTCHSFMNQAMMGIEQTISSVAQERANISSLKGLISNIPSSVVNILLPLIAMIFAVEGGSNGMDNMRVFQIFFPICAAGTILMSWIMVRYTNERVIVAKEHKRRVKFWEGAKELTTSKYFWILTLLGITVGLRALSNIMNWACVYGIGGKEGSVVMSICNMLLNNAFIPGMIFGPLLIKKFGKRNTLLWGSVGAVIAIGVQFVSNWFLPADTSAASYITLVCIFFGNLFTGVAFFAALMTADVLDYHQWKSGLRLEGYWTQYNSIIGTIIGFFTMLLPLIFLSFGGIGFEMVVTDAIVDPILRKGAFKYTSLLALIGAVLAMFPLIFYDLTEKKHVDITRVLKIRAATKNYYDNELSDSDVLDVCETYNYAMSLPDEIVLKRKHVGGKKFLLDELAKYDCIDDIMSRYDQAKAKVDALTKIQEIEELGRNIDMEKKVISVRADFAQKKQSKSEEKLRHHDIVMINKANKALDKANSSAPRVIIDPEKHYLEPFNMEAFIAEANGKSKFIMRAEELEGLKVEVPYADGKHLLIEGMLLPSEREELARLEKLEIENGIYESIAGGKKKVKGRIKTKKNNKKK